MKRIIFLLLGISIIHAPSVYASVELANCVDLTAKPGAFAMVRSMSLYIEEGGEIKGEGMMYAPVGTGYGNKLRSFTLKGTIVKVDHPGPGSSVTFISFVDVSGGVVNVKSGFYTDFDFGYKYVQNLTFGDGGKDHVNIDVLDEKHNSGSAVYATHCQVNYKIISKL